MKKVAIALLTLASFGTTLAMAAPQADNTGTAQTTTKHSKKHTKKSHSKKTAGDTNAAPAK